LRVNHFDMTAGIPV